MKGLIIGGTGTISAAVVNYLIKKNYDLTVLNRDFNSHRIKKEKIKLIKADYNINSKDEILKKFSDYYDFVINFNIFTKEQALKEIEIYRNITEKYFFISSTAIFDDKEIINEKSKLTKKWNYARNKITCENIFKEEFEKNQFPIIILRPSHTVNSFTFPTHVQGLGFGLYKIAKQTNSIYTFTDHTNFWSFISSLDFAKILFNILNKSVSPGNDFNIVNEDYFSWSDYFDELKFVFDCNFDLINTEHYKFNSLGKNIYDSIIYDKIKNRIFDTSKINHFDININNKMNYKKIIHESFKWHINNLLTNQIKYNDNVFNNFLEICKKNNENKFR